MEPTEQEAPEAQDAALEAPHAAPEVPHAALEAPEPKRRQQEQTEAGRAY